jgi:hypothetical protein
VVEPVDRGGAEEVGHSIEDSGDGLELTEVLSSQRLRRWSILAITLFMVAVATFVSKPAEADRRVAGGPR